MSELKSWIELEREIEEIFNNPRYADMESTMFNNKVTYPIILDIVNEIKNNTEAHIADPKKIHDFLFNNENYMENMGNWFPYLSGDRAKLLKMHFYNTDNEEITDISRIREIIKSNDKDIQKNTFIIICIQPETLIKFDSFKNTMKPR